MLQCDLLLMIILLPDPVPIIGFRSSDSVLPASLSRKTADQLSHCSPRHIQSPEIEASASPSPWTFIPEAGMLLRPTLSDITTLSTCVSCP